MKRALILLAFSNLAACGDSITPPSVDIEPSFAAVVDHSTDRFPVSVTRTHGCTGELIVFEGTIGVVSHWSLASANNHVTIGVHRSLQNIAAVSETGVKYRAVGIGAGSFQLTDNPGLTQTRVTLQRWVAQGSADDLVFSGHERFTYNANGELTHYDFDPVMSECQG